MFALGIDPGLTRCGYGAVVQDSGQPRLVASGHLATSPADPLAQRLAVLLVDLEELLADLQPDVVVVERVLFQVNFRIAMSIGQASGLALAVAARSGCPVVQYSPNEVKEAVVGYGGASKEQVQLMVQRLLGLAAPPRPADRADALALALCHLAGARLRAAAERSTGQPDTIGQRGAVGRGDTVGRRDTVGERGVVGERGTIGRGDTIGRGREVLR